MNCSLHFGLGINSARSVVGRNCKNAPQCGLSCNTRSRWVSPFAPRFAHRASVRHPSAAERHRSPPRPGQSGLLGSAREPVKNNVFQTVDRGIPFATNARSSQAKRTNRQCRKIDPGLISRDIAPNACLSRLAILLCSLTFEHRHRWVPSRPDRNSLPF